MAGLILGSCKDLASVFRTRIELRQIGVRDEAKMMGGIGICGRPLCCNCHLTEFHPVSIKMARAKPFTKPYKNIRYMEDSCAA